MNRYRVTYGMRKQGAIGIFYPAPETEVQARDKRQAFDIIWKNEDRAGNEIRKVHIVPLEN